MSQLETRLDTNSEAYRENVEFMTNYVEKVRVVERNIRASEERYRERAEKKGKLLPRERCRICLIVAPLFWSFPQSQVWG